jgi:hypothetical protein
LFFSFLQTPKPLVFCSHFFQDEKTNEVEVYDDWNLFAKVKRELHKERVEGGRREEGGGRMSEEEKWKERSEEELTMLLRACPKKIGTS